MIASQTLAALGGLVILLSTVLAEQPSRVSLQSMVQSGEAAHSITEVDHRRIVDTIQFVVPAGLSNWNQSWAFSSDRLGHWIKAKLYARIRPGDITGLGDTRSRSRARGRPPASPGPSRREGFGVARAAGPLAGLFKRYRQR